jgi:uncharacterized protein
MKRFAVSALVIALSFAGVSHADPAPATDASIHKLLALTQVSKLMDSMFAQLKGSMEQSAVQAAGHPLDAQEQQILSRHVDQVVDVMHTQMSWDKMEPAFTAIYRNNFSQQQINDLLTFYQSPTGQALISKMPQVMQEGMQVGVTQARAAMPQIQQINQEMVQELKDYEAKKGNQASQH